MGRAGVPKKDTEMKVLQGTASKKDLDQEVRPAIEMPDPPEHLDEVALEKWKELAPELIDHNLLTRLDQIALAIICETYSQWVLACKMCPPTEAVTDVNNYEQQAPWYSIKQKTAKDLIKLIDKFGMTPTGRIGLKVKPRKHTKKSNLEIMREEGMA